MKCVLLVGVAVDTLDLALAHLRLGRPVLLFDHDEREGETDLVVASEHATPEMVRLLRTDGGGLLCTVVAPEHHRHLGLPYLHDLLAQAAKRHPVLAGLAPTDLRYDASKPSFGLTINSRRTFTGIPDQDRSTTIRDLAAFLPNALAMAPASAQKEFGARFRSPGHCILLNAADGGVTRRQGHTELSLELMRMAGLAPSAAICEMLDPATGRALGKKEAQAYAERNGLVFLTGRHVVQAWQTRQAAPAPPALTSA